MSLQNTSSLAASASAAAPATTTRHRASASRLRRMSTAATVVAVGLAYCLSAPLQAEGFFLPPTTTTLLRTYSRCNDNTDFAFVEEFDVLPSTQRRERRPRPRESHQLLCFSSAEYCRQKLHWWPNSELWLSLLAERAYILTVFWYIPLV